jgi:hypothetical protein
MGSKRPSQNIHPGGSKLPANILISPSSGWDMAIELLWLYVAGGREPAMTESHTDRS